MLGHAPQRWAAWRDAPLRRVVNEAGADADKAAFVFSTLASSLLLIAKTWLREGLPGLALLGSVHLVLTAAIAALISHRAWGRQLYVAYREVFILAVCLNLQWVVRLTAEHGRVNTMDHHGGSSLKLLGLMLGHTSVLYISLSVIHARLLLLPSALTLAACALSSLHNGPRMCRRLLDASGVEAPLAELHSTLGLLHSAIQPPATSQLFNTGTTDPMQQCLVVSGWIVIVVGALAPYAALKCLNRSAAKRFARQEALRQQQQQQVQSPQPQQPQQQGEAGAAAQQGASLAPALTQPSQELKLMQPYLLSAVVWAAVDGLVAVRHV